MPTYAFTSMKTLTQAQREKIVESVTSIHAVEAAAPRYFVQVVFYTVDQKSMYIGGESADAEHVWVNALIRSGRSKEQKANILRRIMRETAEILNISEQSVWIYISDIPAQGVLEFGNVLPEPGGEEQWLASLPSALREKLGQAA